ncbi:SOS response-associated peptidase [Oceanibaculum pacificum]|uniref:Abasic site processing protein n=1 Tax=Oceanibaculum pacificum TaxID=580166 RepID=A0A154VHU4_9PROT|nr:SOS response-associated peptidase [Oceanibaculum pacificum]KZD00884.1 hypothetical protein AUP43_14215 [Oceanibaculum pacificum]
MCGRYALSQPPEILRQLFAAKGEVRDWRPRYNIAPQTPIVTVRAMPGGGRELASLRWGLVPHWAANPSMGAKLSNARGETVAEKPAFRDAFQRRRCIVPASAFYEWRRSAPDRQPFAIRVRDADCFGLAGIWSSWTGADGQALETVALLTTEPNVLMADIHDRMPVILDPADYERWLTGTAAMAQALIRLFPATRMEAWPVSPAVGNVRNDAAMLLQPAPAQAALF